MTEKGRRDSGAQEEWDQSHQAGQGEALSDRMERDCTCRATGHGVRGLGNSLSGRARRE